MEGPLRTSLYIITAFLAIAVAGYAFSYFLVDHGFMKSKGSIAGMPGWKFAFYIHVSAGIVALSIGWMQFMRGFRNRNLRRHRLIGKVYIMAILGFGAIPGFIIALYANEGVIAKTGFAALAVAWFYTTLKGWQVIRQGKTQRHREWMLRSYTVTFAAVTLRMWLPLLVFGFDLPPSVVFPLISWLCWIPNLLVVELYLNYERMRKRKRINKVSLKTEEVVRSL